VIVTKTAYNKELKADRCASVLLLVLLLVPQLTCAAHVLLIYTMHSSALWIEQEHCGVSKTT
jgi:hypothetical protein